MLKCTGTGLLFRIVSIRQYQSVLAHQGGWDELLFVAGPIVLIIGLLAVANKRAKAVQREREASTSTKVGDPIDEVGDPNQ
jgi:hypothetical protein